MKKNKHIFASLIGGMAEWSAPQNQFLVFEEGPSVEFSLQWATYLDASNESALSRIWGGIHPPVDDAPGRYVGILAGDGEHTDEEGADKFSDAERRLREELAAFKLK